MRDWLHELTAEGWAALIALVALAWTVGGSLIGVLGRLFTTVVVDLEEGDGAPGAYGFVVRNRGRRTAKMVSIDFDLIPDGASHPTFIVSHREPFPIPVLAAGQTVVVPTMLVLNVPSSFEVVVRWHDCIRHRRVITLFR